MIVFLTRAEHPYPIGLYLLSWGRDGSVDLKVMCYEDLWRRRRVRLPRATYVFCDLERLSPRESERAALLWQRLGSRGCRCLNDPLRALRRYELMRALHEEGINAFDVRALTERRPPARYPVFLRTANDHELSDATLLPDQAALAQAVAALPERGLAREDRIALEFVTRPDAAGRYHKYSAFRVGDAILPNQYFVDDNWVVKAPTIRTPDILATELAYVQGNPHRDMLMRVFQIARIDYGRIDYAVTDDRIQVFEINSNPMTMFRREIGQADREPVFRIVFERFDRALAAIDGAPGPAVRVRTSKRRRTPLAARIAELSARLLAACGCYGQAALIRSRLAERDIMRAVARKRAEKAKADSSKAKEPGNRTG